MKKRITQDTQINPLCHPRNPLFYKTNNSLFHTAANDIQQLIGDALLGGSCCTVSSVPESNLPHCPSQPA